MLLHSTGLGPRITSVMRGLFIDVLLSVCWREQETVSVPGSPAAAFPTSGCLFLFILKVVAKAKKVPSTWQAGRRGHTRSWLARPAQCAMPAQHHSVVNSNDGCLRPRHPHHS